MQAVRVSDVEQRAVMKGFKKAQLMQCLENYKALSVWQLEADNTLIRFIDAPDA